MNIVNGFESLRANSLDVPQVKELVRNGGLQPIPVIPKLGGRIAVGCPIAMLHPPSAIRLREMEDEGIEGKRNVTHQGSFSSGDLGNPIQETRRRIIRRMTPPDDPIGGLTLRKGIHLELP